MRSDEQDRIMFRITAAWPRPPIPIETLAIWSEHLGTLDFATAWDAIMGLEKAKSRQPSLAEFHEFYNAARPAHAPRAIEAAEPDLTAEEIEQNKANVERIREMLLSVRPRIPADWARARSRTPRVKFDAKIKRDPSWGKTTVDVGMARYDQVYAEEPRGD